MRVVTGFIVGIYRFVWLRSKQRSEYDPKNSQTR